MLIFRRKIHIWFPAYIKSLPVEKKHKNHPALKHVLFCFVDHFEPGWSKADSTLQEKRVEGWLRKYPEFASQFKDADGYHPRHSWFYPPHYFKEEHILKLISLCKRGFGEIEMHLHHNRMEPFPDTSDTLRKKITDCIDLYSKYGIFKTSQNGVNKKRYAFIHGDWALDNSREGYCGVNDELSILQETGCYADLTFPSYMVESQPRTVNSIYYAVDDREMPKSYDTGARAQVGDLSKNGLLMIQGPLGLRWQGRKRSLFPSVDDGEIAGNNPPSAERVDFWVKKGIHVLGRPEWIIVKAFTHGAALREQGVLLGDKIIQMHSYLRDKYNDGHKYLLHYVTARELYNIIKAAEAGHTRKSL